MAQRETPEPDREPRVEPDDEAMTGTPRWVIVSGIVVLILIVAFAAFHLAGGGLGGHIPPMGGH